MITPDEMANWIVTAAQNDSRLNALELATTKLRQWQRDIRINEIDRCALEWAAHEQRFNQKKAGADRYEVSGGTTTVVWDGRGGFEILDDAARPSLPDCSARDTRGDGAGAPSLPGKDSTDNQQNT